MKTHKNPAFAAVFTTVFLMFCGSTAWAQNELHVGNVIVCYGAGGNCEALDQTNATLINSVLNDGVNGTTTSVAIDNRLHILTTDGSKVVRYTIANVNPFSGTSWTPTSTKYDVGGSAQAVVVGTNGSLSVGTAVPATITQLGPDGTSPSATAVPASCIDSQLKSIDLSQGLGVTFLTSLGGTIQEFTGGACTANTSFGGTQFANLGSGVTFYQLRDIPPNALNADTCGDNVTPCPTTETVLVVARGFVDATGNGSATDAGDFNVCTDAAKSAANGALVSCTLLLDTDPGKPGLTAPTWVLNTKYYETSAVLSTGPKILDAHLHVQQVKTPGRSSATTAPTWNDTTSGGQTTIDNRVLWQDKGGWLANHQFGTGATVGDTAMHLWKASATNGSTGVSGPTQPAFTSSAGSTGLLDGLQWTNTGSTSCPSVCPLWSSGTPYAVNAYITDSNTDEVWVASSAGTSGATSPTFSVGGLPVAGPLYDNALLWSDQGLDAWAADTAYQTNDVVVDPAGHVQQATNSATSGQAQLSSNPAIPWLGWNDSGSTTTDGLTWNDLGTSVVARYPIMNGANPVTTVQALALDPLVAQPTNSNCTKTLPTPPNTVTTYTCASATPTVSSFWVADSNTANFWKISFADVVQEFTAPPNASAGISSIGIYGAEGSTQPGLTLIANGATDADAQLSNGTNSIGPTNTLLFNFDPVDPFGSLSADCQKSQPTNSSCNPLRLTGYNFAAHGSIPVTAYASAIAAGSGTSDNVISPAPPPNPPVTDSTANCTVTTHDGRCVIWQLDWPGTLPGTNTGTNPFLATGMQLSNSVTDPANSVDTIFDQQFDITQAVNVGDPLPIGTKKTDSQLSLHTITAANQNGFATCTYVSPLNATAAQQPPACFTNRNNIPFKFTCTNLSVPAQNIRPDLHVIQFSNASTVPTGAVQEPIPISGTGGTVNYRFDSLKGNWVFNMNSPGIGVYEACTIDATHNAASFCTFFNVQTRCP